MAFMTPKPGQQIGQNGKSFVVGQVFEVPDTQVHEFKSIADVCDKDGTLLSLAPQGEADFRGYRLHEQVSLWERELALRTLAVDQAEKRLEEAREALAAEDGRKSEPVVKASSKQR